MRTRATMGADGRRRRARVLYVHWHEEEANARATELARAGYEVVTHWRDGSTGLASRLREGLAAAVVDLGRLPAQGRGVATFLRERAAGRALPLIFVEGDDEKTTRAVRDFPLSRRATRADLAEVLRLALATPQSVLAPKPAAADYSGTPLVKKLGIKPGHRLTMIEAPKGFSESRLLGLPSDVAVHQRLVRHADVSLFFVTSRRMFEKSFAAAIDGLADRGALWICWPKQASGANADIDQSYVRKRGLEAGLVDNKVCAVDAVWSALRFVRAKN